MKNIKQAVEEMGVILEKFGRSPMEGRVFAYLLISEPPHRSFDEIREFLDASKSAISNALTMLQREGSVTYMTFSGDRKRYFKVDTDGWFRKVEAGAKSLSALNGLLQQVVEMRRNSSHTEFNDKLIEILEFQLFLSSAVDKAVKEWHSR